MYEVDACLGQSLMMEIFNRKCYLVHERKASVGTRSWRVGAKSTEHTRVQQQSHIDLCGWVVLHRSCVAEVQPTQWYLVSPCVKVQLMRLAGITLVVGGGSR